MAKLIKQISSLSFSSTTNQADVEETEWFSWIRRYSKANDDKKERGDNIKVAEDDSITETNSETSLVNENTAMTVNCNTQCAELERSETVISELRNDNIFMANELSIMIDKHHVMKRMMKSIKDNYMVDIQNQQVKHDLVVIKLKDDMTKILADTINHDKLKKEQEMCLKQELCKLRDNFYLMEQNMKKIEDSVLSQNHKYDQAVEKLQVSPEVVSKPSANEYSELRAKYEKMIHRMEKLETSVNSLKCEKQTLLQIIGKMAKGIKSNDRNNILNQKGFKKFKSQMKKDAGDIKKHLNSLENTARKAISKPENISYRKYDKLKMRLTLIEKAEVANQIKVEQMRQNMTDVPSAYIRGGVNDSMANVHYEANHQQAQSHYSVTPSSPSAPPSGPPKVPPPPPFGPPPPSFVSPVPQSGPPRYAINNDLLKAMSSELRKPDGKNIRKIPRRQDMKIPTKADKVDKEKVLLPESAALLPAIASGVPIVNSEQQTLETIESTDVVSQVKISDAPLAVVDTQSALEPPAPSEIPSSSLVESESTVVSQTKVSDVQLGVVDPQSVIEPPVLTEMLSLVDSESTAVPQAKLESALTSVNSEIPKMRSELLVT